MTGSFSHATPARLLSDVRAASTSPAAHVPVKARRLAFLTQVALLPLMGVGVGFLLAWVIDPWVELTVFPLFLMAITACVWKGGLTSGVPALFLSTALYVYFFVEPVYSFRLPTLLSGVHVAEFVLGGAAILFLTRTLRRARERAHEDRAYLLEVLRQMPSGLLIARSDSGEVILWNQGVEKVWGPYAPPSAAPQFQRSGFHSDGRPYQAGEWPLARALRQGEVVQGERIDVVQNDGRRLSVRVNAGPVRDGEGRVVAGVSTFQDVTDLVRQEAEIRRMNTDLERHVAERTASLQVAVRELDAFAYTIAHDLRAPLRSMHGFGDLLEAEAGERLGNAGRDCVRRMAQAAKRMDALIVGLLEYSRLARAEFAAAPTPLGDVCREALSDLREDISASGAEVSVADPFSFEVAADRVLLRQVLTNLVGNAIKFVARGVRPVVRLRAEAAPSGVRLWVEDNGLGISAQHHERIFGVFQRLNRQEEYPGTGIGLSIVRRAVERMNGSVGLRSEPGKGSAFWVELPLAARR